MSFTNLYYKRTAGTQKACYMCNRPTATVLATKDSVDFLYICDGHLKDPGFARPVGESGDSASGARKLGLSEEEIQKVKEEWEEKQKRKKEKEKEKEKEKDDKEDKAGGKEKEKKPSTPVPSPSPVPIPTAVAHPRYALHRDVFAMRLAIHRKRRQTAQAKEIAPRLPSAPRLPVNTPGGS